MRARCFSFHALLLAIVASLPVAAHAQMSGTPKATATVPGVVTLGAGLEIVAPLPNGTDDTATLQALINANPKATIAFVQSTTHWRVSNLVLDDTTGRHFTGSLVGRGGIIDCITPGSTTDSDVAMQRCIAGYATSTSGAGGDLNGFGGTIRDMNINAPTNGAALYLTNGQNLRIEHNTITGGRYSLVLESSQNAGIRKNTFSGYSNAGIGLLMLSDTARVWYASATPISSFFNDGATIAENGFSSAVTGALAHILDHGSTAEGVRNIVGNFFFSGAVSTSGPLFGYIGRNAEPNITGANWFENIAYPIRTLNTNASEGGGSAMLPGVTGAQPSGTYALSNIPDGYGYGGTIMGNYFAKGINDINVSGQYGPVTVGGNFSQGVTGYHLVALQTPPHIMDLGDFATYNGGAYKQIAYAGYTDLTAGSALATATIPGIQVLVPSATATVPGIQTLVPAATATTAGIATANPSTTYLVASSQTVTLPTGWHTLIFTEIGPGGGSGCGVVVASGTAASGGATGGAGAQYSGVITAAQVGNATSLSATIGPAGVPCTASGTISGSSGSTPTAGTGTSFTLGGYNSPVAGAGGAGTNGAPSAASGAGATGNMVANGASGSGATNGAAANGGIAGNGTCSAGFPVVGCGGRAGVSGAVGTTSVVFGEYGLAGSSGSGLATSPAAIAGIGAFSPLSPSDLRGNGGALSCTGTSQNAAAAIFGGVGIPHGVAGSAGASCTASNGGNGGAAAGYGSSGGGGGAALVGFTAGSAGASTGGALLLTVS